VYKKIDEYIQDQLKNRKCIINISIPQGLLQFLYFQIDSYSNILGSLRQCLRNTNKIKDFGGDLTTVEFNMVKKFIRLSGEEANVKICEGNIRKYLVTLEEQKPTTNKSNNIECPLCCDTCDSPYTLQQCGHTYCRGCLNQYFETRFDPTLSVKEFKLCCPTDKCNSVCLIRDIKSILGAEKIIRLAKAAFQIYLKQSGVDLAQCVGIDCTQVS
jgi:hypothetical protein